MTTMLTIGPVHTLAEDVVYAMPPISVALAVDPVAADIEGSLDGSTWIDVNPSNIGVVDKFPFPFIRSHGDDSLVRLTRD